jgi:hypothetical protein
MNKPRRGRPTAQELQIRIQEVDLPRGTGRAARIAARREARERIEAEWAQEQAAAKAKRDADRAARAAAALAKWAARQRFQAAAETTIASQAVHAPVPEAIAPRVDESPRVAPEPVTRGRTRAQAQAPEASPDPPFLETWRRWRRAKLAGDPAARDLKRTLTELASLPE